MRFKRFIIQLLFNFEEQYIVYTALNHFKMAADKKKKEDEEKEQKFTKLWKVFYPTTGNLLKIFPTPKPSLKNKI